MVGGIGNRHASKIRRGGSGQVIVVHGTKTVLDINGGMQDETECSLPFLPKQCASDRGTAPNVGSAKSKGAFSARRHPSI
jgi:hypothetical protein